MRITIGLASVAVAARVAGGPSSRKRRSWNQRETRNHKVFTLQIISSLHSKSIQVRMVSLNAFRMNLRVTEARV